MTNVRTNATRLHLTRSRRPIAAVIAAAVLASSALTMTGLRPAQADAWKQDLAGADTVGARVVTTASYLPPVVKSSSSHTTSTPVPSVDPYALYGVDLPLSATTNNAYNVATINPTTGKNTVQFAWRVPVDKVEQRTVAVDSGRGSGTEGFYGLYRGPYISGIGTPAGMMPVWFFAPGDTKASKMWYVPDLGYFGGNTDTWTNGGAVVNQRTGMLYINAGLIQFLGGPSAQEARFTIFDPKTRTTYWSGPLQPATAADKWWKGTVANDPKGGLGPGAVTSGIAIMPDGDFVLMVKGTDTAIPATNPMNTTGKNIAAGDTSIGFMVRVHPSFTNDPWTYSVMKMVTKDPADKSGKAMWNASNQQAVAFVGGELVVETSAGELFSVDPMTGYWRYLSTDRNTNPVGPLSPSVAPQGGLFYSMSSAQTATSLKGHVYQSAAATYDTSTPMPGVTVALYEQNPAKGYAQPTLISTAVSDSTGQYTFLIPAVADDGSVKYVVRPILPLIDGGASVMVAGGITTNPSFVGTANTGTLYCADGTRYDGANDGVMQAGPCPGLMSPPALETMGTAVDPATFGAYASITMSSQWNNPEVDFNLVAKSALPPSIVKPANNAVLVSTTPTISGTGTAGDSITVTDASGNTVCTAAVKDDGSWTCTPGSALTEGTASWTAIQTEPLTGATSVPSAPVSVTIDTTAPTLTSPAEGERLAMGTPAISGTGTDGTTVTVKDGDGNPIPGCTGVTVTGGAWSCTPTAALPDGVVVLKPVTTDSMGETVAGHGVNVTIDTVAPDAPVITGPADGSATDQSTVTISGTGEADAHVVVSDGATTVCETDVSAAGTWSCDGTFAEGGHTLTATQKDLAGNTSVPSEAVTFSVDSNLNVPDTRYSVLSVDTTTPQIDTPATATVLVKNGQEAPLAGVPVLVTVLGTSSATATGDSGVPGTTVTCVTGADGTCQVVINDHVAEDVEVSAFVPVHGVATEVAGSPVTVTFTPGAGDPNPDCADPARPGSSLSAVPLSVTAGDPAGSTVTAFVTDA
ncbi:MAG: Ig-like domain-containing protein, partial [Actinomycetia bacterium]|nr:Ig-like domain-containing protein [Actinomycetes bacterium]